MKHLAIGILLSLVSSMSAQAIIINPNSPAPALPPAKEGHNISRQGQVSPVAVDAQAAFEAAASTGIVAESSHIHDAEAIAEGDTCHLGSEFLEAAPEYVDCYNCMFPPEWLRSVEADMLPKPDEVASDFTGLIHKVDTGTEFNLFGSSSNSNKMVYPVQGGAKFLSGIGDRRSGGRRHQGVDLANRTGTPIVAVLPGRVTRTGSGGLGGWSVRIDHPNGMATYYAHLNGPPIVRQGALVAAGEKLGGLGDSGNARGGTPHLHFEIRKGRSVLNPVAYIGGPNSPNNRAYASLPADKDVSEKSNSGNLSSSSSSSSTELNEYTRKNWSRNGKMKRTYWTPRAPSQRASAKSNSKEARAATSIFDAVPAPDRAAR